MTTIKTAAALCTSLMLAALPIPASYAAANQGNISFASSAPAGDDLMYIEVQICGWWLAAGYGRTIDDVTRMLVDDLEDPQSPVTVTSSRSGSVAIALKEIGTCRVDVATAYNIDVGYLTTTLLNNPGATLYPRFVVLAVMYAPPGPLSSIDYGESTKLGTSTSVSHLFSTDVNVMAGLKAGPAKVKLSQDWTAESDTSSTIAVENTQSVNKRIYGPVDALAGINHDADRILVWINPKVQFVAMEPTKVAWDYTYDTRDPVRNMHVLDLTVADLKAWLAGRITANDAQVLARSWAGANQGITPQDLEVILAQDPFSAGFSDRDVIDINPGRFVAQGADGIFTYRSPQIGINPDTYSFSHLSQTSRSSGSTYTNSYSVGVSAEVEAGFFVGAFSGTCKWTNKSVQIGTTADSRSATVSLTGPLAPLSPTDPIYTGPTQVQIYLDTLYDSYVFAHVPPINLRQYLRAYYPFAGNVNDYSDFHGIGTNKGATLVSDRKGAPSGAYHFNGASYIDLPTNAAVNKLSSFTLSAWIKPDTANHSGIIVSKVNPNRDFVLALTNGTLTAQFADGTTGYHNAYATGTTIPPEWTFVAATWNGSAWQLYVNATLVGTASTKGASPLWTGRRFQIGTLDTTYARFSGAIDDVRVYNRALTKGELDWLMWQ